MDLSYRIRELFAPHPDQHRSADERVPAIGVIADDDGWVVHIYPADSLSALDRAALWEDIAAITNAVISERLPECKIRIIPPGTFADGTEAQGVIQYAHPGGASGLAARYWWSEICAAVPEISTMLSQRVEERYRVWGALTPKNPVRGNARSRTPPPSRGKRPGMRL